MNGGMNLKGPIGLGAAAQEEVKSQWDTFDDVEVELAQMGVFPEEKPKVSFPKITSFIMTTADDQQFQDIYYNSNEWHGFLLNTYARLRSKHLEVKNELKELKPKLRSGAKAAAAAQGLKKPPEKELDDIALQDPYYRGLLVEDQRLEQKIRVLGSKVEILHRNVMTLSRVLESRRQEREGMIVGENLGRSFPPGRM